MHIRILSGYDSKQHTKGTLKAHQRQAPKKRQKSLQTPRSPQTQLLQLDLQTPGLDQRLVPLAVRLDQLLRLRGHVGVVSLDLVQYAADPAPQLVGVSRLWTRVKGRTL